MILSNRLLAPARGRPAPVVAAALLLVATGSLGATPLRVAAASSLRPALEQIRAKFEQASGQRVEIIHGSSGLLAAQIRQGAPFDLLLAADRAYSDSVRRWGRAAGPSRVFARGTLVLWTSISALDPARGPAILRDPRVRRVAIADPSVAPYGREAMRLLRAAGLERAVGPKLIRGENISQATQYAATGAAEAALTAKPQALSALARKGRWADCDTAIVRPIEQTAVLLRSGKERHAVAADRFLDFLTQKEARAILSSHGYLVP